MTADRTMQQCIFPPPPPPPVMVSAARWERMLATRRLLTRARWHRRNMAQCLDDMRDDNDRLYAETRRLREVLRRAGVDAGHDPWAAR